MKAKVEGYRSDQYHANEKIKQLTNELGEWRRLERCCLLTPCLRANEEGGPYSEGEGGQS